jgi:hypothetical protein
LIVATRPLGDAKLVDGRSSIRQRVANLFSCIHRKTFVGMGRELFWPANQNIGLEIAEQIIACEPMTLPKSCC